MSPAIPPAIPPRTGIRPYTESLPISEKISFDVMFSGSGISSLKRALPSAVFNPSESCLISFILRMFDSAFSRILPLFSWVGLFDKNVSIIGVFFFVSSVLLTNLGRFGIFLNLFSAHKEKTLPPQTSSVLSESFFFFDFQQVYYYFPLIQYIQHLCLRQLALFL